MIKTVKEVKAGELYNTLGSRATRACCTSMALRRAQRRHGDGDPGRDLFEDVFGEKTMHECYDVLKSNGELNEELIEFFEHGKYYEITAKGGSTRISRRRARRQASAVSSRGGNPERSSDGERPTSRSFEAIRRFERFERGFTRRSGGRRSPAAASSASAPRVW